MNRKARKWLKMARRRATKGLVVGPETYAYWQANPIRMEVLNIEAVHKVYRQCIKGPQ